MSEKFWEVRDPKRRAALKEQHEREHAYQRIAVHPPGIVEKANGAGLHCYAGQSQVEWFFNPGDELSRRFAWAMALTGYRWISGAIIPRPAPGYGYLELYHRGTRASSVILSPVPHSVRLALDEISTSRKKLAAPVAVSTETKEVPSEQQN